MFANVWYMVCCLGTKITKRYWEKEIRQNFLGNH